MTTEADERGNHVASRYFSELTSVLGLVPAESLARVIRLLLTAREKGRRIYVMGNGGSAAVATHFVCDLVKTAQVHGFAPLRAYSLTDNASVMTAWANDTAYDRTFAEQINSLVEEDDVVIGISSSGRSPNIVAGFRAALVKRAVTVGFLGFDGGDALPMVDMAVHIPCHNYGLVEDSHAAIGHAVTAAIRQALLERAATDKYGSATLVVAGGALDACHNGD